MSYQFCLMLQRREGDHALIYRPTSKDKRELGNRLVDAARAGDVAEGERILDEAREKFGKEKAK